MGDTSTDASNEQHQEQDTAQPNTGEQKQAPDEQPHKSELSAEQLQEELAKVRREAAKYRTERNQLRAATDEKSKADRSDSERIAALEKALAEEKTAAARAQVAAKAGVPPELITGNDPDEMADKATQLSDWINSQVEKQVQERLAEHKVMPVVKGENAGGQPLEGGDWLRKMFQKK